MFKFRLNLVFFSAVLAVGLVLTTKANVLGKKAATDCFEMAINVINSAGTVTNELVQNEAKASIVLDLAASPYLNEDISASSVEQVFICPLHAKFCCAIFTPIDPRYSWRSN
ncbi:hypothetical protein [Chitinophaga sp. 22620]|uniref:hypothetical protein n=1 Tax=Chitinophaga sp. 22620 TaxID=3453952 RepID=UPI003F86B163